MVTEELVALNFGAGFACAFAGVLVVAVAGFDAGLVVAFVCVFATGFVADAVRDVVALFGAVVIFLSIHNCTSIK